MAVSPDDAPEFAEAIGPWDLPSVSTIQAGIRVPFINNALQRETEIFADNPLGDFRRRRFRRRVRSPRFAIEHSVIARKYGNMGK
jgi:hypothetical protein